jgi:deazaflavin-dependent oxidoreductase (nitroreductase family)
MARSESKDVLTKTDEIELTVAGRRSGRKTTRPVWFVQEGKSLYLLPVTGSDTEWYKNILKNPTIMLAAEGEKWTAKATPITDAARVSEIVEKFRAKHGAADVKKYYLKFDVAVEVPLT